MFSVCYRLVSMSNKTVNLWTEHTIWVKYSFQWEQYLGINLKYSVNNFLFPWELFYSTLFILFNEYNSK